MGKDNLLIGSHVSMNAPDYYLGAVKEMLNNNANTLMLYTGAPQNASRIPLGALKIEEGLQLLNDSNVLPNSLVVHAPYIINLASPDPIKREFAIASLVTEVERTAALGINILVVHPGSSMGKNIDIALQNVTNCLNEIIQKTASLSVIIAIETMAGKGTEVCAIFEEIASIINGIEKKERIAVCFDTCHVHDSGYDIKNDYSGVMNKFDEIIGLEKIAVIHLNDSKNLAGSKKDRHSNIGCGYIGFTGLMQVVNDKRFLLIPKILETPYIDKKSPYQKEIEMIRNNKCDVNILELFNS